MEKVAYFNADVEVVESMFRLPDEYQIVSITKEPDESTVRVYITHPEGGDWGEVEVKPIFEQVYYSRIKEIPPVGN